MTEMMPEGQAVLRTVAMPADVNGSGDIFGGWVLSQLDLAGGVVAADVAKGRVATVAVDAMKFIRPVQVSDILCVYGHVERLGTTSVAVRLDAWVVRGHWSEEGTETEKVTEALFTFVAIDEHGQKRPINHKKA